MDFAEVLERVRREAPLVQCITNFITANDCANIILAAGGSPSMAHDIREVEEAVTGARGLVCNLGAVEDTESMVLAGRRANEIGVPVVLDPVAAGGTQLRREAIKRLLDQVHFTAIRGNASEIRAIAGQAATGSGVDVSALDVITQKNLPGALELAGDLAGRLGSVVAVSGAIDLVCDGKQSAVLRGGCATMARITGSGCMLTSLMGAFCAAVPEAPFEAACAAMGAMGVCGERAEALRLSRGTGNATFRTDLIDAMFNLTGEVLMEGVRYELYQR